MNVQQYRRDINTIVMFGHVTAVVLTAVCSLCSIRLQEPISVTPVCDVIVFSRICVLASIWPGI